MSSTKKIKLKRETPAVDFSLLPDVVMIEIFSYLDYYDLCRCARVCRHWRDLKQCGRFKKSIIVKRIFTEQQLNKLVQSHFHEGLEVVELTSVPQFLTYEVAKLLFYSSWHTDHFDLGTVSDEAIHSMQVRSPYLRKLVFDRCQLNSVFINSIPTQVRHLGIRNCDPHKVDCFNVSEPLHLENVTCLEIVCSKVYGESFDISCLKNLRCLYLQCSLIVSPEFICSHVDILSSLHILDVEGSWSISNENLRFILDCCTAVKELYIGFLFVDDDALSNFSIRKLPNLTTLCVASTHFTPDGLQKFMKGCKREVNILGKNSLRAVPLKSCNTNVYYDRVESCNHYLSHTCPC